MILIVDELEKGIALVKGSYLEILFSGRSFLATG